MTATSSSSRKKSRKRPFRERSGQYGRNCTARGMNSGDSSLQLAAVLVSVAVFAAVTDIVESVPLALLALLSVALLFVTVVSPGAISPDVSIGLGLMRVAFHMPISSSEILTTLVIVDASSLNNTLASTSLANKEKQTTILSQNAAHTIDR